MPSHVKALVGSSEGAEISLVIGQRQQDLSGDADFDMTEGFSGRITQLFLVDRVLDATMIKNLFNCKEAELPLLIEESVIPWGDDDLADWFMSNVEVRRMSISFFLSFSLTPLYTTQKEKELFIIFRATT